MRQFVTLTLTFFKAYLRDRSAIFFSILVPVIITSIFGVLTFGGDNRVGVGVVDEARNDASARFIAPLKRVAVLDVSEGDRESELAQLRKDQRSLVIVFPKDFAPSPQRSATIVTYAHAGRPQQAAIAEDVLTRVVNEASFGALGARPLARVQREDVDARRLTYVDFLIPGMVAMSVMQLGLFTVAFGVVQQKRLGVLRRLMATPLRPRAYFASFTATRLVMTVFQVILLVGMGVLFFRFTLLGSFWELIAVALVGGAVFLTHGFALAGRARTEDQAAPVANLMSFPQMFLSGVFFPRENVPDWLRPLTELLPLSFFADASRAIATEGLHLWDVGSTLLGLALWGLVGFVVAVRFFRFE